MIQKLHVPVSVISVFDHKTRKVLPKKVLFEGREHVIVKIGYHHTYRDGRTLLHVFSVASDRMFFKLVHDTETLAWTLEEVDDGEVT